MNTDQSLPLPYYSEWVITVRELKDFLMNFPDDAEVWVCDRNGKSNEVKCLSVLGKSDVILEPTQDGYER
jgi:hypothetical protein